MSRLLTASQMQAVDAAAVAQGIDSFELMCAAGKAVCDATLALLEGRIARVLVLAGPGNNGGDGAIAAKDLSAYGHEVAVLRFVTRLSADKPVAGSKADNDAARAFLLWDGYTRERLITEPVLDQASLKLIDQADVIVDALFGAGLSRPLDGSLARLVERVNETGARVVAVDVPSGLNGDSHVVEGACIQADVTVTFFLYKPAHFLYPGRALCGRKVLAQIGLSSAQLDSSWPLCVVNEPSVFATALPTFLRAGHKFDRGHVLVRSGPMTSTGASRLSAQTGLNCGAGLVTLASDDAALAINAAHLTAVMLTPCNSARQWQGLLQDDRINAVVVGPGNGITDATRACALAALAAGKHVVLDADALSCWQQEPAREQLFSQLASAAHTAVLTPHAGEFTRLFGQLASVSGSQHSLADNLSDETLKKTSSDASSEPSGKTSKLHQAMAAATHTSSVIVYKGADTVIASPDGRSAINANAPPWLATAGAGDVLAGLIASLLAQGMSAFEAACAGVWLHGQAAVELGYPMTAEQLTEQVSRELHRLHPVNGETQVNGAAR